MYFHPENQIPAVSRRQGKRQFGVTSIEYALIASLIAMAILVSLQATGDANESIWSHWTQKAVTAFGK